MGTESQSDAVENPPISSFSAQEFRSASLSVGPLGARPEGAAPDDVNRWSPNLAESPDLHEGATAQREQPAAEDSASPEPEAAAPQSGERGRAAYESASPAGFPREVFWNLPNTVTMLRIAVVPVLLFLPSAQTVSGSRFMAWAVILASLSDLLDGWLARRNNGRHITRIGKLLDPLADKLLVSTALIMLLAIGRIPVWGAGMVVVIVGRELAVTGLRGIASSHGHVVAATWPGKLKTLAQNVAAIALLFHYETFGLPAHDIGMTLLAIATALTLWSGYTYFSDYFGWNRSD